VKKNIDPSRDLAEARTPLNHLSKELLRLHKLLLDITREDYERVNGRIENSFKILELVLNDPYFAWLRKLSELIVVIDEITEREIQVADVDAVRKEVELLVLTGGGDADFRTRFEEILKREVTVLMQQNVVRAAVNALPREH
jgi:hypothetical protein